jgi:hypothetical protein
MLASGVWRVREKSFSQSVTTYSGFEGKGRNRPRHVSTGDGYCAAAEQSEAASHVAGRFARRHSPGAPETWGLLQFSNENKALRRGAGAEENPCLNLMF